MRQRCTWSSVGRVALVASVCLVAEPVFAQEAVDEQKVNTLFNEARDAFVAGDYATACPKYEEVVRIKPGLGARIGLGDCYRAQGRLSKAWEVYKGVIEDVPELVKKAKGFTEQSKVQKRGDEAKTRIKEIEPKLGWMVLVVPESVLAMKDAVVHVDGIVVDRAKFGVRMPVDRGEHVVHVYAPGKKAWDKTVALVEGAELSVTVQALEDEPPPVKPGPVETQTTGNTGTQTNPPPLIAPDKPPPDQVRPPPDTKNGFFSTQRIIGLSLGAVGAGALIAGAVFGNRAIEKRDASEEGGHCVANRCDQIGLPLRQESLDAANLSTGFFVGGGVALAAGAAIFLIAPKQNGSPRATLVLGPSSLHCIGRF